MTNIQETKTCGSYEDFEAWCDRLFDLIPCIHLIKINKMRQAVLYLNNGESIVTDHFFGLQEGDAIERGDNLIGFFGKFWDDRKSDYIWGRLYDFDKDGEKGMRFWAVNGVWDGWYKNFEPCLPEIENKTEFCGAFEAPEWAKAKKEEPTEFELNNWLDFDEVPPPKELTYDFVSWSGLDDFCRLAYWSPKHQAYIDAETDEVVHPDFWLPLFAPNDKRYNHKYILSERTLTPEEVEAMYGHTMKKFLERQ